MTEASQAVMTDPYIVYWHLEETEGHQWIVVRVPQCSNQATQGETFDDVRVAVQELVALWNETTMDPANVLVGAFYEETEADFLAAVQKETTE